MAAGYGTKGFPKYDSTLNADLWTKLQEVAEYAAYVGNRMAGTRAEREALSTSTTEQKQRWEGLAFSETDQGLDWRYTGGAWKGAAPWGGLKSGNTNASGIVTVAHPWGVAPSIVQVTMHFLSGADAVAAALEPVVWIVDAANIQIRFKRTATSAFEVDGQPVAFMLATWA